MSNPDMPENLTSTQITDYDFEKLLLYSGPSRRRAQLLSSDVSIFDYLNCDRNENNISILLSSQDIEFHIDRPHRGWSQSKLRLVLSVPPRSLDSAANLLKAATKFGVIEQVEGLEGMPGY